MADALIKVTEAPSTGKKVMEMVAIETQEVI
jgi:hypothetical protein